MSKYFIGIMTGTSADALDGCIVSFEKEFSLEGSHSINLGTVSYTHLTLPTKA